MMRFDADLYRRLLESSPEGVAMVDALAEDQPVVYVNPAFEALTGYPAADLLGKNLRLLQGETGSTFTGNLSWIPYVICTVVVVLIAFVAVKAVSRGQTPNQSSDKEKA